MCGAVSSLVYAIGHDLLAALLWPDYSPFGQTISELSAIGAPTMPAVSGVSLVSSALVIAFGVGVRRSAPTSRALRITGALLIGYGVSWLLWLPFPARLRGVSDDSAFALIGHSVVAALTVLLIVATVGVGSVAVGTRFRTFSRLTLAVVLAAGALSFTYAPRLAAGEPTPWFGVVERISVGAWLLWVAVLSVVLLRECRTWPTR